MLIKLSGDLTKAIAMSDDIRRGRLTRDMERPFLPDYDAANMPSADKRAAYALEHIAFRMSRIDDNLNRLVSAIAAMVQNSQSAD
jgi:hypothetical protein